MSPEIILNFENSFLRVMKTEDVDLDYVSSLNDPDVNRFLEIRHTTQNYETVSQFVLSELQSPSSVLWGIWDQVNLVHIGTVRIHNIEFRHLTASIGICIFNKSYWGRGIGRKAIMSATKWAINELGMRWVEAGVYENNESSINTF